MTVRYCTCNLASDSQNYRQHALKIPSCRELPIWISATFRSCDQMTIKLDHRAIDDHYELKLNSLFILNIYDNENARNISLTTKDEYVSTALCKRGLRTYMKYNTTKMHAI